MRSSPLSLSELSSFKQEFTDENRLIGEAIREIIPPSKGGIILDVGAGLGDIAAFAFPERSALLIDVLDFPEPLDASHSRQKIDFLDFEVAEGMTVDVLLLSHVLQYLDDDIPKLVAKITAFDPPYLITVANEPTVLFREIEQWFSRQGIVHNGERIFPSCPMTEYRVSKMRDLTGKLKCPDFETLATQLANVIYDTSLDERQLQQFCNWIGDNLIAPEISIPQSVTLYEKGLSYA